MTEPSEKAFALSPPHGIWVDRTYSLKVAAYNLLSSLVITCRARLITLQGDIVPFEFSLTPTSAGLLSTGYLSLFPGWLVGVTLVPSLATLRHGQCFVRVSLQRGVSATFDDETVLVQTYLSSSSLASWPGGHLERSTDGRGYIFTTAVANPTVGTDFVHTVPTNTRQIVHGVAFTLTTDANVANRRIQVVFTDDTPQSIGVSVHTSAQTASSTVNYFFVPNFPVLGNSTVDNVSVLPVIPLLQGYRVTSGISNIQVGDQLSNIVVYGEQWIED